MTDTSARPPSLMRLTVVVGASRGIGRHLALRAAQRGDRVLACARDSAALDAVRASAGDTAQFETLTCDLLAPGVDVGPLAAAVREHSGPVSVIVSAATLGPVGPLTKVDTVEWADAVARNVSGTARIIAACVPAMTRDDALLVFSGGGVGGPNPQPNVSSYTTSKAALMHLVEVVGRENPTGPTVVAIAPGSFPTGFTAPVLQVDPELAGLALLEDVERTQQREFDPTDLDALVDYLETQETTWLSGRSLSARWETPDRLVELTATGAAGADLFTLRRVDGAGVTVSAW